MFKNWMNKPWTWGTYFKLCGIGWLIAMIELITMRWWAEPLTEACGKFIAWCTGEEY